jgi:hypothetical protein
MEDHWYRKAMNKCGDPNSFYPPGYKEETIASACACCKEPVSDLNLLFTLPCGKEVCESCYYYDFGEGLLCPSKEDAGTDVSCLDCIFSLVEAGPGYYTHSDADPGL